jgi:hypothetical protein
MAENMTVWIRINIEKKWKVWCEKKAVKQKYTRAVTIGGCNRIWITRVLMYNKCILYNRNGSRDSLVGIATGYGLDDQGEREFESQ